MISPETIVISLETIYSDFPIFSIAKASILEFPRKPFNQVSGVKDKPLSVAASLNKDRSRMARHDMADMSAVVEARVI